MNLAGKFIVVDGPDGSGKGTQLERLAAWIKKSGTPLRRVRDPGGTEIGDRIRHVLLDFDLAKMSARCETLLFMASRAQLVAEKIRPALDAGQVVLCDRFISATYAYQGAAGFPYEEVIELGRLAVAGTWPDLTLVFDVPPEVGLERTGRGPAQNRRRKRKHSPGQIPLFEGSAPDAMERRPLEFHRRVRQGFLELPNAYPSPVVVIDAARDADTVFAAAQEEFGRAFE